MLHKLFIHIPKNAGMTVRRSPMLATKIIICGKNVHKSPEYSKAVLDKMNANGDHHGYEHARWRDIHPTVRSKHGAFAVVRNPWDRVVSRFFFAKKIIEVEKKISSSYADVSSFEAFLEERHKWGGEDYMWHRAVRGWYPAHDHVVDDNGIVKCDMMRFENLDEDLCKYFNLASMSGARNVTALNKGTYRDMYTPETIQTVADWYQKDIDHWGYDFDTGPTKNYWAQT
tara:strand:- start:1225 stop:1908 length:684 start_codon:yes stop_codon:yes gene_type:complete